DLKQKINHGKIYDGDDYSNDVRCSLVNGRDKYKEKARSESRDKHRDELHVKRGSKSRDLVRERSHSQSGLEDEDHWKRRRRNEYIDKDSDDERTRNREREMDRDRRREKGRERSRDIETYMDRRKTMERERSQEREGDRDRRWEKRHGRRDLDIEHEQRRDQEHSRSRDRELDPKKRREREQEKDSYKYTERDRGSDKYMERDRGKDKEGDKYRERDREYDHGSERGLGWRNDRNSGKDRGGKSDSATFYGANSDSFENGREKVKRDEDEQEDFEERMTLILAEEEDDELDRIKEESRRLREAILEKYRKQQLQQASEPNMMDAKKGVEPAEHPGQSLPSSDNDIALQTVDGSSGGRDMNVAAPTVSLGKSPLQNVVHVSDDSVSPGGLGEGTPKSERSEERYCDDIFGETPTTIRKVSKVDGLPVVRSALHDNWDDAEGYYSYRFGEILDGRYEIIAAHGRGVFSTVVRAKDLKAGNDEPEEVAIKIIRNNETMNKISQVEVSILNKLAGADLENRRHCVRFLSHFKYRNHTCLVFESLHMNLREILKKFGRNIGLKLTAIRAYAKQLFIALKHLRNCGVLHCDIKPDNMLVNEAKNVLKLCDFGNAMFSGKNEITPYLVSRFYRAPEIILGLSYDHPMDIWSVGCCLYELYTGKVLFPGSTNNDMLRLHMELKGPFPKKMLKKGAFVDQHFDHDLNFYATEQDSVSDKIIKRMIVNVKPKDIGSIVKGSPGANDGHYLSISSKW
ncbi:Serine/threonine-protein kinase PRP4 homolog, partial [Linum perenne]